MSACTPLGPVLSVFSCLLLTALTRTTGHAQQTAKMETVHIGGDGKAFVLKPSGAPFRVWGVNYDHDSHGEHGRLLEDYWETEWQSVVEDFREIKELGANAVRIHLQIGKFLAAPDKPNATALATLQKLLTLAEETGLYLNITGLGCYHKADTPAWYDALPEQERWKAQAVFWSAVAKACRHSPAVFCYDLMNEPVIEAQKDKGWLGGELGGKHYVQALTRSRGQRTPGEVAKAWIEQLTTAIRAEDPDHLITVGVIPWAHVWPGAKPVFYSPEASKTLDFVSIHLYPKKDGAEKAVTALKVYDIGKPIVVEETFPLECTLKDMDEFLTLSKPHTSGYFSFYWGRTIPELANATEKKEIAALVKEWLISFKNHSKQMLQP